MPQNDRHKEREIPIEFDFYNTLESLPVNRLTNWEYWQRALTIYRRSSM